MYPMYRSNPLLQVLALVICLGGSVAFGQQARVRPPRLADCTTLPNPVQGELCEDTTTDSSRRYDGTAWGGISSNLSDSNYLIWAAGSTYYSRAAATGAVSSGADPGALIQAAITALSSTGGKIVLAPATYTYTSTVPKFPSGIPAARISVVGYGATISLATGARQAFGINRQSLGETIQNITLEGFSVDGNSLGGKNATIFGNLADWTGDGTLEDLDEMSYANLTFRNLVGYDVLTDSNTSTNTSGFIYLRTEPPSASGAASYTISNILIEGCSFTGGNWGVLINGSTNQVTKQRGSDIVLRNLSHDMRPAGATIQSTQFSSTCFHVGSRLPSTNVVFDGLRCYAPGDNCFEWNQVRSGQASNLYCSNPVIAGFTFLNAATSVDYELDGTTEIPSRGQSMVIDGMACELTADQPTGYNSNCLRYGGTAAATGPLDASHVSVTVRPGLTTAAPQLLKTDAAVQVAGVTIRDSVYNGPSITADAASQNYMVSYTDTAQWDINGDGTNDTPEFSFTGLKINTTWNEAGGGTGRVGLFTAIGTANFTFRDIVANVSSNTDNEVVFFWPGLGGSGGTISAAIDKVAFNVIAGSASAKNLIRVPSTTFVTMSGTRASNVSGTTTTSVDASQTAGSVAVGTVALTGDSHTAVVYFSDATGTTHDTGTLVCSLYGLTCVDTSTLAGDTSTQTCSTDWNSGAATPFYAYCR